MASVAANTASVASHTLAPLSMPATTSVTPAAGTSAVKAEPDTKASATPASAANTTPADSKEKGSGGKSTQYAGNITLKRASSETFASTRSKRARKDGAASRPANMNARPSPLLRTATSDSIDGGSPSPAPQSPTSSPREGKGKTGNRFVLPAFLSKLYEIVDDENWSHVIKWSANGTTFVVVNETELSKQVLPRYFKHNNFSSFVRQLNMYGFRKLKAVLTNDWEYHHPKFQRGKPALLHEIKRRWSGPNNANNGSLPAKAQGAIQNLQEEKAELQRRLDHYKSMVEVLMKEKTDGEARTEQTNAVNRGLFAELWHFVQGAGPNPPLPPSGPQFESFQAQRVEQYSQGAGDAVAPLQQSAPQANRSVSDLQINIPATTIGGHPQSAPPVATHPHTAPLPKASPPRNVHSPALSTSAMMSPRNNLVSPPVVGSPRPSEGMSLLSLVAATSDNHQAKPATKRGKGRGSPRVRGGKKGKAAAAASSVSVAPGSMPVPAGGSSLFPPAQPTVQSS